MKKIIRKLLLTGLVLVASATPYVGVAPAAAAAPQGHCKTCSYYFWGICWLPIADSDC